MHLTLGSTALHLAMSDARESEAPTGPPEPAKSATRRAMERKGSQTKPSQTPVVLQEIPTPFRSGPVSPGERKKFDEAQNILIDICKLTPGSHPEVSQQGINALKQLRLLDGRFPEAAVAIDPCVFVLYVGWMMTEADFSNPHIKDPDVTKDHCLFLAKCNLLKPNLISAENYEAILEEVRRERKPSKLEC